MEQTATSVGNSSRAAENKRRTQAAFPVSPQDENTKRVEKSPQEEMGFGRRKRWEKLK